MQTTYTVQLTMSSGRNTPLGGRRHAIVAGRGRWAGRDLCGPGAAGGGPGASGGGPGAGEPPRAANAQRDRSICALGALGAPRDANPPNRPEVWRLGAARRRLAAGSGRLEVLGARRHAIRGPPAAADYLLR